MQKQLNEEGYSIYILGVNEVGFETANTQVTEGRDLPWLQDTADINLWGKWDVGYRDVIIFDKELTYKESYNLSINNLNEEPSFEDLYSILTSL